MPNPVTRVSFFDIWKNNHSAVYNRRFDRAVPPDGHRDVIREAVNNDAVPNGPRPTPDPRPGRELDIPDTQGGRCAYVFRLDNGSLDGRLVFARNQAPIVPLPLNSGSGETFITDVESWDGERGRWASFACDLDAVRGTELARRIRSNAHGHGPVLTIPFYLNVFDPELEASPWVVPNHPHHHQQSQQSQQSNDLVTHGGVHPPEVVYLTVPL